MVYGVVAVQVVDAPGAKSVAGQVIGPDMASTIAMLWTDTVPVLVTVTDQVILSPRPVLPSWFTSTTAACFVADRRADWATGVSVEEGADVTGDPALWPLAVAVFETVPASTSTWVTACADVAAQVVLAPGARDGTGQVTAPAMGSVMPSEVTVVVPALVTRKV